MNLSKLNLLKYLPFACLILFFKPANAQVKYDRLSFRIDSFANVGLPKSALKVVDTLDALAKKTNNAPQQIRAAIYRMTFQSYLEEDALVAIINRLKLDIDNAAYPVKPVLQSLLAQMYWNYYQQNRYKFSQRTKLAQADTAFTNWDISTIINETNKLYALSLHDAKQEQNTPIGVLDGVLKGDSTTRYLRPTLYDLLVQRAFDFFLSEEAAINKPKLPFSLNDPQFFSDSGTFTSLIIKTTDTASTFFKGLKYLQQATAFHLEHNDEEALADLDLKRLKFLYDHSTITNKDSLYLKALKQIADHFSAKPISAEALVLEGQYYQGLDSLTIAHSYFEKAVATYPKSLGGKNAAVLIKQIEEKELSATVEDVNVPGKPILGLVSYKNISSTKITFYKLSEEQVADYNKQYYIDKPLSKIDYLKKLPVYKIQSFSLPNPGDFRKHSVEFYIEPLNAGNYVLLFKELSSADSTLTSLVDMKVSNLSYVMRANPDENIEIRVLDRETGAPLNGIKITLSGTNYKYNSSTNKSEPESLSENGTSDKNGMFISSKFISQQNVTTTISQKGDTLKDKSKYLYGASDNTDDDTEDKTILFTDRQIYRPGQTIYFKGLQLQTFKGKSKIKPDTLVEVQFLDINNRKISALQLKTNGFGTFSGSFLIPQTMLSGNVTLSTDQGEIEVKVEEYKRPSFQVTFLPVKESYKLNDSVTVKGNVAAFSGYGLSQARVSYHITRIQNIIRFSGKVRPGTYRPNYYNPQQAEIEADTIVADSGGKFEIKFKARPNEGSYSDCTYTINADVTDESGETHSNTANVVVGNNNIQLVNFLPVVLFAKDSIITPISIQNLNGQFQKGEISVEVYALKNAGGVFKNRLWQKPDQFIISKDDFKKEFAEFAFKNEDDVATWALGDKVIGFATKVDESKPAIVDFKALAKQPSGMYRVFIHGQNKKGDTTSLISYITVINQPATPTKFDNWIIPVLNAVNAGENAEFLVGIGKKINVLVERYNGAKLKSSRWVMVQGYQQNIKIPIADTDRDVAVQFLMVYQNRVYTSYQKIYIAQPDKNLKIKLLTFHNKLLPGQKEEWKLQISNSKSEKQAAEMVADLYDASLDDIIAPKNWSDVTQERNKYQPNYFAWLSFNFIQANSTSPIYYRQSVYGMLVQNYEHLNLFGFDYYGGYNNAYHTYQNKVKQNLGAIAYDKLLRDEYAKNAAQIKNGHDVTGFIVATDDGLPTPGVKIKLKGYNIGTTSDSKGFFKIKVPLNATLIFSYIGYETIEVKTSNAAALNIKLKPNSSALNEVVVTGYGVQRKADMTGAVQKINIRGLPYHADTIRGLLQGQASGVNVTNEGQPGASTAIAIRGIADFGSYIQPIVPRSNFSETAFFYPQLQTNEKGEILIDFTIPEALTRWKFRGFAHTKDLSTGYIENTVVTQKQLSISANTPRFLREGDSITISARLANLTAGVLKGKVQLKLFNALNMQPVNLFADKGEAEQSFEVAGNTNKAVSFRLLIPAGLDALTYRLTADAGQYTDGEENTLAVLPNRMLVTESMPMMVRAGQTRNFTFDKLVNQSSTSLKNKTLTLEYTQNPAWYAVQALPYMMEFPYECSEQVFSRYYANTLATSIVNKMPAIKRVFEQWKSSNSAELLSNLEKNQELKSTLIEETPWLNDAISESEQKKRIALLFDLNKMSDDLKLNLDKLQKRQLPDGGFTWFGGNAADRYITQHIVEGMGELFHLGIANNQDTLKAIADNALKYLDNQLIADEQYRIKNKLPKYFGDLEIHAWYTRSFYSDRPLTKDLQKILNDYLNWAQTTWTTRNVYEQGLIALTMQRYKKPEVTAQIEKSLLETAQHSEELGMYWAANRQGYFWYESPIETQSLLIELFTEVGDNAKAVDEMKIWLLRNKQTNDWKTTKATAAACYALLLKGNDLLADTGKSTIKLNGKPLEELKPDVKADTGTGYIKTTWVDDQIKPQLGKVEINNTGKNISWGALHWQYLENLDKITSAQTNIHMERKYFIQKQTDAGPVLTAVDAMHVPKTGDLLKVVVHLKADRDFEYVQLKDMRPAGTEPVEALSTYKYQDGLYYYQVSKDVATNFFISELSKGNYVFEYQLRVAQPGNFSTGITSVQCMYAPEFNAHSQGGRMGIKP